MITIKKYPNRRLYDTSKSHYINLETVKELVKQSRPFQVVDSKTGVDISRQILLQIITEHETLQQYAILSQDLLQELIRQYGGAGQADMHNRLQQSLQAFLEAAEASPGSLPFETRKTGSYGGSQTAEPEQAPAEETAAADAAPADVDTSGQLS